MPDTAAVSIVVPTFDRAALLEQALESAILQDHPSVEVVVVDDGSTDRTPDILERYAADHPARFRFARQANAGQASALARGFDLARGDLVGYLSSDDLLLPGAVTKLVRALTAAPRAVLAYPGYQVIDDRGDVVDTITPPEYSRVESVRLQDTVVGPGALFRRSVLERIEGWSPDYRYLGDFDFWLRMSRLGPFVRVPEPLACWRRHDEALTVAERGLDMARERIRLLDELYAGGGQAELEVVRGEAYRNAFVLAAIVAAPGANEAGERYYIADSHARAVSVASGPENPEAKLAEMRERVAGQRGEIDELRAEVASLRADLLRQRPAMRMAARLLPSRLRPLARRLLRLRGRRVA
jgi:hypothetical protein